MDFKALSLCLICVRLFFLFFKKKKKKKDNQGQVGSDVPVAFVDSWTIL